MVNTIDTDNANRTDINNMNEQTDDNNENYLTNVNIINKRTDANNINGCTSTCVEIKVCIYFR